jgi:ABC-2 type transport system permease protein
VAELTRYFRLLGTLARFALQTELAFRANFLVKLFVEGMWLGMLLVLYDRIFANIGPDGSIAGWTYHDYFFFIGCYYALGGIVETLFLENCTSFADLVRTGDLDFFLLRPIDEQFLLSCRHFDWSTAPNILLGVLIMAVNLHAMGWAFDPVRLGLFLALFVCGCAMAYAFLLMLSAASVWMVRNQSLLELWWLFTTLMRYPRQIYRGGWATAFGWVFTFVLPVLLAVGVPAETMVKTLEPGFVVWVIVSTAVLLVVSRWFFFRALRSYRSASS